LCLGPGCPSPDGLRPNISPNIGSSQRCQTFPTRREAETRDHEIRDLRDRGRHESIDAGSESLAEATERWWVDHVESSVSQSTAKVYASALDLHLLPRMGSVPIRDIQPADVVKLQRDLRAEGVGAAMTQKTLMVLSGIMRHSQLLGRIPANPVGPVRIKQPKRQRAIRPLAPATIERMRALVLARDRPRDAALLSLLAYAGLRPGEAFAVRWDCVGDRALIVEHGRADGSLKATKTDRIRTVGLLQPVLEDLEAWRAVAAADGGLLFPRRDGDVFHDADYQNWRRRIFDPTSEAAGTVEATPYTLRHSFASLLVQAGWNALEIATEMGNSPEVVQRDSSHLFREFARGERIDPESLIADARSSVMQS
jgi:integrase